MRDSNQRRIEELRVALKGKEITIIGHDNIDVDSVLSGMLMSNLLDFLNVKNHFCLAEELKKSDTYDILKNLLGIDMCLLPYEGETEDRTLFLVDHYETIHQGEVVGCIDHHPTQKVNTYQFKYVRNSCASAYLIYELMQEVGYPITQKEAKMIIVAMMIDTMSFRSSKAIKEEVVQAKNLAKKFNIDYNFYEKECLCLTPIDDLTFEEIISNGQKWYDYNGHKVGSSYLQVNGFPDEEKMNEWLCGLKKRLEDTNSEMLVFIIFETKFNMTYEYRITKENAQKYIRRGILSRGKDIMPRIEKLF